MESEPKEDKYKIYSKTQKDIFKSFELIKCKKCDDLFYYINSKEILNTEKKLEFICSLCFFE